MKAWIIRQAGGPEKFWLEGVETPSPRKGWAANAGGERDGR